LAGGEPVSITPRYSSKLESPSLSGSAFAVKLPAPLAGPNLASQMSGIPSKSESWGMTNVSPATWMTAIPPQSSEVRMFPDSVKSTGTGSAGFKFDGRFVHVPR